MVQSNDEASACLEEEHGGFGFEFSDDDGWQSLAIVGRIAEFGREEDQVDVVDAQLEAPAEVVDCDVGLLGFGRAQVAHFSNMAIMFI